MIAPPPLDRRAALFLDVDGTLLEIAPRPELVKVPPGLPDLLRRLSSERNGALALISGRPIAELDRLFRPWSGAAAGLHGVERRRSGGAYAHEHSDEADPKAAAALDRLRPELAGLALQWPGAMLEDKGRTLAFHYRAVPEAEATLREAVDRLFREHGDVLRLIPGKMVIEFLPRHHDKGRVIAAFMSELPFDGRLPVYLGDDATDEDGFTEVNRHGGIAVRVGPLQAGTAAKYALPSVRSALEWLASTPGKSPI